MAREFNTDWTGIPHTDKTARVHSYRNVKNARVIHVTNGSIRGAIVSGAFELVDTENEPIHFSYGKQRAEVYSLWYRRKPLTTWMHLAVGEQYRVQESYSGPVVANIAR